MFKIILKNYRCFSESSPATIDLDSGFIALIGTNNSGKSSFLRFFIEFRSLFVALQNLNSYFPSRKLHFGIQHVEDWIEIFNNSNQRDIIIEISKVTSRESEISKIRLILKRNEPNQATIFPFWNLAGNLFREITQANSPGIYATPAGNPAKGDTKDFIELAQILNNCFYVGPFRNAISEGTGQYYDISIGTGFIQRWDSWKTGSSRVQNHSAQQVADDIAHIFDFSHFEINATPAKNALHVIIERKPYLLRELGAGLAQFIIVFGNVAMKKPTLLLIDEPELNLHPSLQMDFLTSLASYASYGVVFASHSVGLARAVSDRIYTFQKINNFGAVKPFDQIVNYAEFIGEMSFSSFKEIGCDRILLVEGVTEVKAIQQFLRVLRKDHETVLLPLGGSQMIRGGVEQELSELKRLSNNISVLIDSECKSENEPLSKDRSEFISDCNKLGFKTHTTKLRAFENYFLEHAIKAEKGDSSGSLGPYEKLSNTSHGWAKSDNWKIARRMSRDEVLATDLGQFLNSI